MLLVPIGAFLLGASSIGANGQCTNSSSYGSAIAPASGSTTISTCSYQNEYSTVSSVAANTVYSCTIASGGYITIHEGTPAGPVIAHGPSPLQWTSTVAGTYFPHWTVNAACVTTTGCVNTSIAFIATLPATPPTPTQDPTAPTCTGGSALSVSGTPGTNEAWYWQTTALGTSMATPYTGPYSVFANGTYYLRAYNTANTYWSSSSSSVVVSNFPTAAMPAAPTPAQNPACNSTTLVAGTPPAGTTYYWQTVANGSSNASDASTPLTATTTGTYYLAAYETASQCWSATSSTAVTIQTIIPPAALANPDYYNYCTSAVTMPVSAQLPPPTTNTGTCSATATASGNDGSAVTATVTNFSCAPTTIVSASMNASIGQYCALYGWYSYDVIVNGVTVLNDLCDQSNIDLTPYLPLTSVSIVSQDDDGYAFDFVNMSLTVNVSYITDPYTLSWYAAPTGGTAIGTGTTIESIGTPVLPVAANGNYQFYAANNQGACQSATRTLVNVNVTDVLATLSPINVTCNGGDNGSFSLGTVQCGTAPFLYSINAGPFIPIPTDLVAGTYSIVMQDANLLTSAPITIVITEPAMPSALNATNVTYYNATLGWTTTGNETSWTVIYGETGFDPATEGTILPGVTNPYTLTGELEAATGYEFYVFADCGALADTAGPLAFVTDPGFPVWDSQCGPGFVAINATGTALNLGDDATTNITLTSPVSYQGVSSSNITVSNNGWVTFGGVTLNAWQVDLDDELGNVYWQELTIGTDDYLIVEWFDRAKYVTVAGQQVTFEIAFNKTTGEIFYLYGDKVFGGSQATYDYAGNFATISASGPLGTLNISYNSQAYLQNNSCIRLTTVLCPNITNFSSIIYPDEVNLSWDAGLYGESDWTIVYGEAGFDPTIPGEVLGTYDETTDAVAITNLAQNTEYDVYIYSECMADNITSEGYFYNFTTLPFCANPSAVTVGTDVDSLELTWNWTEYTLAGAGMYVADQFNIMYEMNGVYMNEVIADGINFADTVFDTNLIGSGVYQVYVQAECASGDTSAWTGPITVVMPLSNDTVCGAEMLEMDYVYTLNNVGATVSVDEINVAPPATGAQETDGWLTSTLNNTVWYRFVAPASGSVRINNTAINYNGQLAVYDAADCGDFNSNFNLVAANDNEIAGSSLAPNFTICGLTPGDVYYVMHDGIGTTGNYSISISEIVLQAGSAQPTTQICYGEILDLNTTIAGNDAGGAWSAPVAAVNASITGSMFNSNGLANQTFSFQYRMTDGCAYDSIVSQVQIFAPSNAGTDGSITICKNEPVNLFGGLTGTVDLNGQWYDPSDNASTADIVGSAFPGSFNYDYITGNGVCPDDTSNVLVVVLSTCDITSVDEASFSNVQLYPNPTSGIINIDADKAFNVEVTDANGRMIKKDISTNVGTTSIDLGKVQVGVYFVTLRTEESSKVYRVVVQ